MLNERVQAIADVLNSNEDYAKEILTLSPAEAAKALATKGYDFTVEELIEFVEEVKKTMSTNGELGEDDLENVTGGCKVCLVIGIGLGIAAVVAPW